jgi:hypothetical protein
MQIIIFAVVAVILYVGNGLVRGCALGIPLGAVIGFLLRPSVPLVGQLPLEIVLTRGSNLVGVDRVLQSTAEQSFNYIIVGAIIGAVALGVVGKSLDRGKKVSVPPTHSPSVPATIASHSQVSKFCTKCGKAFAPDVLFCGMCGNHRN